MATFIPRQVYPHLSSIPRSYFLGHHAAGLSEMKTLLGSVDLIVECRDYRTPLSSRNPLFEQALTEKPRLIVYTRQDLGSNKTTLDRKREEIIQRWDAPSPALFANIMSPSSIRKIVEYCKSFDKTTKSLFGTRIIIAGMPNIGKSSLINALRNISLGKKKTLRIGDQPGITRKIETSIKIADGEAERQGIYLIDTPGVFVPYVADAERMLKLALCGNVKDTIIPPTTIADYLLFHLNLQNPKWYERYCEPTNDIFFLLAAIAKRTGRLKKGGEPENEGTALWLINRWRHGYMGKFILDEVTEDGLTQAKEKIETMGGSMNQARKAAKQAKKDSYLVST